MLCVYIFVVYLFDLYLLWIMLFCCLYSEINASYSQSFWLWFHKNTCLFYACLSNIHFCIIVYVWALLYMQKFAGDWYLYIVLLFIYYLIILVFIFVLFAITWSYSLSFIISICLFVAVLSFYFLLLVSCILINWHKCWSICVFCMLCLQFAVAVDIGIIQLWWNSRNSEVILCCGSGVKTVFGSWRIVAAGSQSFFYLNSCVSAKHRRLWRRAVDRRQETADVIQTRRWRRRRSASECMEAGRRPTERASDTRGEGRRGGVATAAAAAEGSHL